MVKIQSNSIIENSRLSRRNQIVVPAKIRRILGLKGGDELFWRVIPHEKSIKVLVEPKPKNWAQYAKGLGKKIWGKIDVEQYVQNLRQEWKLQK